MSRYIDADALKEDLKEKRDYLDTNTAVGRGEYIAINKALTMVDEQPTVDAVPVDFINQKIVELQSCAIQHFDDGHEILATCVWETIRLLGSFLKEWRGKEKQE